MSASNRPNWNPIRLFGDPVSSCWARKPSGDGTFWIQPSSAKSWPPLFNSFVYSSAVCERSDAWNPTAFKSLAIACATDLLVGSPR